MSENNIETDHEYDGIREYDNPLPMWWLTTFFGTIIFGFLYWLHYSIAGGPSQREELRTELLKVQAAQQKAGGTLESEEELMALVGKADVQSKGKDVYAAKCAVCHGPELQGVIGPNLTDDYWIHGKGKMVDIIATVRKGVLDKGMPAWEGQLQKPEIQAVVAFVVSKRGSNPPNAKPPQGEKVAN